MSRSPRIDRLDATYLSHEGAHKLATLMAFPWPSEDKTVDEVSDGLAQQWRGYDGPTEQSPHYLVIRDDGGENFVATAQVQPRTITTPDGDLTILALARVCVDPSRRGEGLGAAVVRAAFALVDDDVFPFSLYQTTSDVRPFYEKLGACVADNKFVNSLSDDPDANPFPYEVIMRYPCGPGWPNGTIDLLGPGY